ncbi:MAG: restriction endonuclease subunit S [Paraclostridium sp.]
MSFKEVKLGDIVEYSKERCNIEDVTIYNYISTENMIPDKAGVTESSGLPNAKTVSKYNSGDILISNIRPYFKKIWYADKIGGASNDVLILNVDRKIADSEYVYYCLNQDEFFDYMMQTAKGTKMPRGDKSAILNFDINLHTIEEQKSIAKILSDVDNKIEVNNKINQRLEDMAQSIFKHWFVDFEFPNEEGKPYKSSGGEMVESELGMIPKGWEVSSLSQIANYLNGLAMQKFRPESDKESLKVMKIKELRQGTTDNNSDLCSINIDRKYIANDGDVIFSWSGSLLVDIWCGGECGLNQHLFKVTSETYNKWFYYMWTKYHLAEFIKIAEGKATTMGHIKRSELDTAKVLIPNKTCLEKMNLLLDSIIEKAIKVNIESKKLSNLRDTLLPKLMSGEIRVPIK